MVLRFDTEIPGTSPGPDQDILTPEANRKLPPLAREEGLSGDLRQEQGEE